jgi:hypothetical protein
MAKIGQEARRIWPATKNVATSTKRIPTMMDSFAPLAARAKAPAPWIDARASEQAARANVARQASGRRRMIDPTTCDRDYSAEELQFMRAMQEYKKSSGRMFPTWSETLEVLRGLGYEKAAG